MPLGNPLMSRRELQLDYQVFLAPREVRTLEMPAFTLRLDGTPRVQTLRIDAWPVVVAPLVPVDAPARHGLGSGVTARSCRRRHGSGHWHRW